VLSNNNMVGPQDGGFGFDQSKKYSSVENMNKICVQCQELKTWIKFVFNVRLVNIRNA